MKMLKIMKGSEVDENQAKSLYKKDLPRMNFEME